jgi:hypothetical protein
MSWGGHVARKEWEIIAYWILVIKPKRIPLGRPRLSVWILLCRILGIDCFDLAQDRGSRGIL